MTMNEIRELLEYDAWATRQLLEAAATLGSTTTVPGNGAPADATWTRDLNGALRTSLRQQLVHLVITVDTYRAMLQGKEPPEERAEEFAEPAAALSSFHEAVCERMSALLDQLPDESLNTVTPWHKNEHTLHVSPAEVLRHVVNHGTYHRGQVAALLKLQGVEFPRPITSPGKTDAMLLLHYQVTPE